MQAADSIEKLSKAIDGWFQPDNIKLKIAIEQTVDEGFFSFEDIKHQIRSLKNATAGVNLLKWAELSGLQPALLSGKNILCLHAGNLPLVGFQDTLSVMMTGGNYVGKISRKDPYLLPAFLEFYSGLNPLSEMRWALNIDNLNITSADALIFAGSEKSASEVRVLLQKESIIRESTPCLIRTAHFSVAYITNNNPETLRNLTEAVFRYGGAGCRSVAIVVAPFGLNDFKCSFTDYVEEFWLNNPQHSKPAPSLFHRYAFNKAMKIEQAWLDDYLIEEQLSKPSDKFILQWIKGDKSTLNDIVEKYRDGLQAVYSTEDLIGQKTADVVIEPLSTAQNPPIWWKPDQIDTIEWLQENAGI
ncbi:MAG: hypothetical protein EA391_13515 [Balneolaceae bacterium]|nr:MAG: hypothetical protein EA391_13515 [Balneolaceae bacterium]